MSVFNSILKNIKPTTSGVRSVLFPNGNKRKSNLAATVILTSLVDAFSILVIYLLVSLSHSGEILYVSKGMELPEAAHVNELKRTTLLKIEDSKYFLEDEEIGKSKLVKKLHTLRKKIISEDRENGVKESDLNLMIQADKKVPFKLLNTVIRASSHAGFDEIKFTVLAN